VRASGKMVRGRKEASPDPQELLRDTDINDGTFDNEFVFLLGQVGSRNRHAWFLLVSLWRAFRALVARGSR
jgi:hypothetical protein